MRTGQMVQDFGRRGGWTVVLAAALLLAASQRVAGDGRDYVWTYEWKTMPRGQWEAEWYFEHKVKDTDDMNGSHRHLLELEYGITDRWDVAVYGQFQDADDPNDTDYDLTKVKLRTRYRIGRDGQFLMNPLIYLEYQRAVDGSGDDIGEAKLILDRHFGRWDLALNFVWEGPLDSGDHDELKVLAGFGYEVTSRLHVGLEARTTWEGDSEKSLVGPTLSYRLGDRMWLGAGVGLGLDEEANDLEFRSIVGFFF